MRPIDVVRRQFAAHVTRSRSITMLAHELPQHIQQFLVGIQLLSTCRLLRLGRLFLLRLLRLLDFRRRQLETRIAQSLRQRPKSILVGRPARHIAELLQIRRRWNLSDTLLQDYQLLREIRIAAILALQRLQAGRHQRIVKAPKYRLVGMLARNPRVTTDILRSRAPTVLFHELLQHDKQAFSREIMHTHTSIYFGQKLSNNKPSANLTIIPQIATSVNRASIFDSTKNLPSGSSKSKWWAV